MLTCERADHIASSIADAFAGLPSIMKDIRETLQDREALIVELDDKIRTIDTMNVLVADLRHQIRELQDRMHEYIEHNAKLENIIMSAGRALSSSESFVSAARSLVPPPGHSTRELPTVDVLD